MDYTDARNTYFNDPAFKNMVDSMVHYIHLLTLTPAEMRAAAMLASIIHEERNPDITKTLELFKQSGLPECILRKTREERKNHEAKQITNKEL